MLDIYLPKAVGEPVAKKDEENELLEIVDPSFIRVLRYTENVKNQERVINQVRKSQLITQRRVIVIDPGHGGHDPGAIGYMNIREKEVVLAIGKKLAEFLEEDGRFKVIMTRKDDTFIPLQERSRIALSNRADLLISIHADAHPQKLPLSEAPLYLPYLPKQRRKNARV